MGKKSGGGAGNREAKVAKAGKRHGHVTYPLINPLPENLAARDKGEQQFISDKQLTVEREGTVIVFDKATKSYVYKTKKITLPAEFVYDKNRGRVVYSPSFKEKSSK